MSLEVSRSCSSPTGVTREHISIDGKFLRLGESKFYVKGFCYGPFAENSRGEHLPENEQMLADFAHMRRLGANTVRLYSVPSSERLDQFVDAGLRVFLDIPWQKHRCFL